MRRGRDISFLAALLAGMLAAVGARAAEDQREQFVVIQAGRVITLAGPEYTGGQIVLVDGKVRLVGADLEYPASARVIDARGEVVMPGMIHLRTRWDLPSYTRSGVHADRNAEREVFLSEIDFEALLRAGFTAVCFYPGGTGITGRAAVYRTAGDEKIRHLGAAWLRITMTSPGRDKKVLRDAITRARREIAKVEKARKEWEEKQKKGKEEKNQGAGEEEGKDGQEKEKEPGKFTPPRIDPAVLPLVQWLRDKKGPPLLFELSRASDYRHLEQVLAEAPELPLELLYLSAGSSPDYHYVIAELGERKATVVTQARIGYLPYTVTRYHLPAELVRTGCRLALVPMSDSAAALEQLRSRLAELVRAGLSREDALKAVTLRPAEVLGLAHRLGTIEKGKEADLVFLDGDPLAPGTRVYRVMIAGRIVWEAPEQP